MNKISLTEKYPDLKGKNTIALRDSMTEIDNLCSWSDDVGKLNTETVKRLEVLEGDRAVDTRAHAGIIDRVTQLEQHTKEIKEWIGGSIEIIDGNTNRRADAIDDNRKNITKLEHRVKYNREEMFTLRGQAMREIPMDGIKDMADKLLGAAREIKPIPTDAMERRMKYGIPLGVGPQEAEKIINDIKRRAGQEEDGCPECHGHCGHSPGCSNIEEGDEVFDGLPNPFRFKKGDKILYKFDIEDEQEWEVTRTFYGLGGVPGYGIRRPVGNGYYKCTACSLDDAKEIEPKGTFRKPGEHPLKKPIKEIDDLEEIVDRLKKIEGFQYARYDLRNDGPKKKMTIVLSR